MEIPITQCGGRTRPAVGSQPDTFVLLRSDSEDERSHSVAECTAFIPEHDRPVVKFKKALND